MAYAFDTPLITTDQSIDRVLAAGLPVALVFLNGDPQVDFDDALKRLAKAHAGKLLVVKVNPKDSPAVARRFEVAGTPTFSRHSVAHASRWSLSTCVILLIFLCVIGG